MASSNVRYAYDKAGRLATVTYPDGTTVAYGGAAGSPASVAPVVAPAVPGPPAVPATPSPTPGPAAPPAAPALADQAFCTQCGAKLAPGGAFCTACGAKTG